LGEELQVSSTSEAFFGLRLPLCNPGKARNTIQILPSRAKAASTATIVAHAPNQVRFLIGCQNSTGFSKKEQGIS